MTSNSPLTVQATTIRELEAADTSASFPRYCNETIRFVLCEMIDRRAGARNMIDRRDDCL